MIMKILGWLLAGAAAGHIFNKPKSAVNITLKIEQPDASPVDSEDSAGLPANSIYVRDTGADRPRFYTKDGREVDKNGYPI